MSIMKTTHAAELATQGWSRWEIFALGADKTILPRLGAAIFDAAKTLQGKNAGKTLMALEFDDNYVTLDASNAAYISVKAEMKTAMEWCSENLEEIFALTDTNGHSILRALGNAMIAFGTDTCGYPSAFPSMDTPIPNEARYELWKARNRLWGTVLATQNMIEAPLALAWVGEWFADLWD